MDQSVKQTSRMSSPPVSDAVSEASCRGRGRPGGGAEFFFWLLSSDKFS